LTAIGRNRNIPEQKKKKTMKHQEIIVFYPGLIKTMENVIFNDSSICLV
jgi:hypothetical protein